MKKRERKIRMAASISIEECDSCGAAHIIFHDEDGNPFAQAVLENDAIFEVMAELMEVCGEVFDDDDEIGKTMGTA